MPHSLQTPVGDVGLVGLFAHPHYRLIQQWFDPTGYLNFHDDVAAAVDPVRATEFAGWHFLHCGFNERRIYCPQLLRCFTNDYYRRQLGPTEQNATDYDLAGHWLYEGVFAGLAPNETTDAALTSEFHIFNLGRVGSHAIARALEQAGRTNVVHTHTNYEFSQSYIGSSLTYQQLVAVKALEIPRAPITFISGVRDPIEWAVSALTRAVERGERTYDSSAAAIAQVRMELGRALTWFDHEYFQGIDVYDAPFDTERGFGVITQGRTRVLLYRVDKLSDLWPSLACALDLGSVGMPRDNVSRTRRIADLVPHVPDDVWEAVSETSYLKHFFSEAERGAMEARWLSPRR